MFGKLKNIHDFDLLLKEISNRILKFCSNAVQLSDRSLALCLNFPIQYETKDEENPKRVSGDVQLPSPLIIFTVHITRLLLLRLNIKKYMKL